MGDTGPCGPCSELHYCLGLDDIDPRTFGEEPAADGRGWFELWNLVFMQFDRHADGHMESLPAPSIDTGAGLERIAVVKQGVLSNYDTDLLRPIVDLASEISGKRYRDSQSEDDVSMRVIADHARTTAFLISEGVFPDKDGRAYVLRRVMRRAIRHGHRLGIHEPFLHHCALRVVDDMGDVYPQLAERRALIEQISLQEEERFRRTLDRGLQLISENKKWIDLGGVRSLPGEVAFKLYDTYGFPLDLQNVIGEEQGFVIDQQGFDAELGQARLRSQGSKIGSSAVAEVYPELAQRARRRRVPRLRPRARSERDRQLGFGRRPGRRARPRRVGRDHHARHAVLSGAGWPGGRPGDHRARWRALRGRRHAKTRRRA